MARATQQHYEVIVIGAGVAGIYQIKRLADLGVDATVLEAAADLGGTWYNNRYPGARFDSESYTYGYSFSREVLEEWHWKETFSPQPENLRYLNYVAEKFDLRQYMQFDTRVEAAHFDEANDQWHLTSQDGRRFTCRFMIMTLGLLSMPTLPRLEGRDDFKGRSFHSFDWPHEPLDLSGKRVAVIGTGATAIQIIPEIAGKVAELTVFQRRPNWAAPLNNARIDDEEMAKIRARYDEIFATCARTPGGFEHEPDRRGFYEVSREERVALWDRLYDEPGFGIWLRNFREIFMDEQANAEFSEYIADRIRQRVHDPETAEKLIPRDHGFGVQRVPLETHYYEAYNRDNVHLVDLNETPLERVTESGLRTSERDYEFDVIVYRFRRHYRRLRSHRYPRCGRNAPAGQVAPSDLHVPGYLHQRVPQPPDAQWPAERFGVHQLSARHRGGRGLVYRLSRTPVGKRRDPFRSRPGGRRTLDQARRGHVLHDAHAQGQVLVHRLQLQRGGP